MPHFGVKAQNFTVFLKDGVSGDNKPVSIQGGMAVRNPLCCDAENKIRRGGCRD
jgi:hypothetical protein